MALKITDENFKEVLTKNEITVVDFFTTWCGPCKTLGIIMGQLANENPNITIGKLNVEDNSNTSTLFGIKGVPTTIFFKGGIQVDKIVGMRSKVEFQSKIDTLK